MLFTWFMLAGLIFLFAPQGVTNKFQFTFARVFRWPLSIGRNISLSARTQQLPPGTISRRESQYSNYIADLEEQLRQKQRTVEKLSGLRNRFYALEGARLMIADVTLSTIDSSRSELMINRGKDDGLAEGQYVLGDNSIVGIVSSVDSRQALVKLFTDPVSNIPVKIGQLEIAAVARGTGNNSAKIRMIPTRHKIRKGETVYALKKPGLLDCSMTIGTVAQCKKDDGEPLLWDITVEPACDIVSLTDVAVIIMNP